MEKRQKIIEKEKKLCRAFLEFQRADVRGRFGGGFTMRICRSRWVWGFRDIHSSGRCMDTVFPSEMFSRCLLLVAFLEKNGFSGVGRQASGRGQDDVSGAISYLNASP